MDCAGIAGRAAPPQLFDHTPALFGTPVLSELCFADDVFEPDACDEQSVDRLRVERIIGADRCMASLRLELPHHRLEDARLGVRIADLLDYTVDLRAHVVRGRGARAFGIEEPARDLGDDLVSGDHRAPADPRRLLTDGRPVEGEEIPVDHSVHRAQDRMSILSGGREVDDGRALEQRTPFLCGALMDRLTHTDHGSRMDRDWYQKKYQIA